MEESISLLEQVSRKELALKAEYESASRKAENMVDEARKNAEEIVGEAESTGSRMAGEYYRKEMASARDEAGLIRKSGEEAAVTIRERGKSRLPQAVERIVRSVSADL